MTRVKNAWKWPRAPLYLGIEAGGTRTLALLAGEGRRPVRRLEAGPANLRLLDDAQLARHFRGIARALPRPTAIAIGMAGARTAGVRPVLVARDGASPPPGVAVVRTLEGLLDLAP